MRASILACTLAVLPSCFSVPPDVNIDAARSIDAARHDGAVPDSSGGPDAANMPDAAIDGAPNTYHVGGQVAGMWNGAAVQLHLTATGVDELLTVDANAGFNFNSTLADGASFSIGIATQPSQHNCVVNSGIGTVNGADNLDARIVCTGPTVAVALSAPLDWTFDAGTTSYALDASVLVQQTTVTVTSAAATGIALNGMTLSSGVASAAQPLALGANTETILVTDGPMSQTYTIGINRGGAAVAQYVYGKASNPSSGDQFGNAVAIDGDLMAVGALDEASGTGDPNDNSKFGAGAVYVFHRVGSTWTQEAYLKAASIDAADGFGWSVALSGDTLAVGADGEDSSATGINGDPTNNGTSNAGAVYVFRRVNSTWSQEAYIKPSTALDINDQFGWSVALSGNTLVVGSYEEDSSATGVNGAATNNSATDSGAAWVFVRGGASWSQQAYLKASNTEASDWFGQSVAISGDTVLVGASGEDSCATGVGGSQSDNNCAASGAVYVFHRSGTAWSQQAYLKASNTNAGDNFGFAVAIDTDSAVIGAPFEASGSATNQNDNSQANAGAAYTFRRSGTVWSAEAYLKPTTTTNSRGGYSVAIAGDMLAIGARTDASTGKAHVYHWNGANWVYETGAVASNGDANDYFGNSVSLTRDGLVAGAPDEASLGAGVNPSDTINDGNSVGAAYVYR